MRSNKKLFKSTFRQHKRNLKKCAADTLASNLIGNSPTNQFWRQMRLQSSTSASAVLPPVVIESPVPKTLQICGEITMANYSIIWKLLLTKAILLSSSGLRNVQSVQMHRGPPTSGGPPFDLLRAEKNWLWKTIANYDKKFIHLF